MDGSVPVIGRRARRACLPCASMKAKCITKNGSSECERCQQQKRAYPVTDYDNTLADISFTRVKQLEQKVDGLMTLLGSSQRAPSAPEAYSTTEHFDRNLIQRTGSSDSNIDFAVSNVHSPRISLQDQASSTELSANSFTSYGQDAEELLRIYREEVSVYFPFVIFPSEMSAQDLAAQKPLVWKVIVIITAVQCPPMQVSLGKSVVEDIVTSLMLHGKNSFELLQAILLYATWQHQFAIHPQVTNFVHLAKALVANLGIDRWPSSAERRRYYFEGNISSDNHNYNALSRSTDERRALLGCLFIDSVKRPISHGKIDQVYFSSYVQHCLKFLEEKNEYLSDGVAAYLIKIQEVSQKIIQIFPTDEPRSMGGTKTPTGMYVKALEFELENLKNSLPHDLCQNLELATILLQYYAAEILLYEVGLDVSVSLEEQGMETIQRLDILSSCLHALKAYFDIYSSLPKHHFSLFPVYIWTQYGLFLQVAARLCFVICPGWDLTFVREQLCIPTKFDSEISHFGELIKKRLSIPDNADVFSMFLRRMNVTKSAYENRIEQERIQMENQGVSTTSDPLLFADILQDFDDTFWEGLQNETL
ncbi:hypothetical protein B7463_g9755, partial [Scytalidium lignicola]